MDHVNLCKDMDCMNFKMVFFQASFAFLYVFFNILIICTVVRVHQLHWSRGDVKTEVMKHFFFIYSQIYFLAHRTNILMCRAGLYTNANVFFVYLS